MILTGSETGWYNDVSLLRLSYLSSLDCISALRIESVFVEYASRLLLSLIPFACSAYLYAKVLRAEIAMFTLQKDYRSRIISSTEMLGMRYKDFEMLFLTIAPQLSCVMLL